MAALQGHRILLGVSGGIAAYKAADLVRKLRAQGAEVRVVLTESAERFVTATTFQALSANPVRISLWDEQAEAAMSHIELARWADQVLIAPATANVIARLSAGLADDLLSTVVLATQAPLVLAPAMNTVMLQAVATQENLRKLQSRGARILGPGIGDQACGETGAGRMLEPHEIVEQLIAHTDTRWQGRRVVLTAGPSFEDIDPVRFIGNRSSGKMGFALATEAARLGATVVLIAGPVHLPTPAGVKRLDVRSAAQMYDAALAELKACDVFIGAAAVADFTPEKVAGQKIKKSANANLPMKLVPTQDILAAVSGHPHRPKLVVGFAAETEDLAIHALKKLTQKKLDLIAANQVGEPGSGFESDNNELQVMDGQQVVRIGPASKTMVAQSLMRLIADKLVPESNSRKHKKK